MVGDGGLPGKTISNITVVPDTVPVSGPFPAVRAQVPDSAVPLCSKRRMITHEVMLLGAHMEPRHSPCTLAVVGIVGDEEVQPDDTTPAKTMATPAMNRNLRINFAHPIWRLGPLINNCRS